MELKGETCRRREDGRGVHTGEGVSPGESSVDRGQRLAGEISAELCKEGEHGGEARAMACFLALWDTGILEALSARRELPVSSLWKSCSLWVWTEPRLVLTLPDWWSFWFGFGEYKGLLRVF